MPSLIETLAQPATTTRTPKPTRYDEWIATRPEAEQSAIWTAVTNPAWGHTALLKALRDEGAPEISSTSFQTWRENRGLKR